MKYLSLELNEEEARELEQRLAADQELQREFELFSEAFRLVDDQLRKRDEHAFRSKLLEVMERRDPVPIRKKRFRKVWAYTILPLAGALALLLVLMRTAGDEDRIFARFYHPEKDQVLLAIGQVTRGGTEHGYLLYHEGKYEQSMTRLNLLLEKEPDNRRALLYYLLASMEMDMEEAGLEKYAKITVQETDRLDRSLLWYASLALFKTDRMEEASGNLDKLVLTPGPYQSEASRLQKVMSK